MESEQGGGFPVRRCCAAVDPHPWRPRRDLPCFGAEIEVAKDGATIQLPAGAPSSAVHSIPRSSKADPDRSWRQFRIGRVSATVCRRADLLRAAIDRQVVTRRVTFARRPRRLGRHLAGGRGTRTPFADILRRIGMSRVAAIRGFSHRGASMINGDRPTLGPNAGLKARKIGSARARRCFRYPRACLLHWEGANSTVNDRHLGNVG